MSSIAQSNPGTGPPLSLHHKPYAAILYGKLVEANKDKVGVVTGAGRGKT